MSSCDQDSMSDPSSSTSTNFGSPHSPPSQQVPQLAHSFTELTCGGYSKDKPFLVMVEQPQNHFRFRYRSEMVGTHGCLLGRTSNSSKTKTHPMVELINYNKRALIRCRLVQHLTTDEHPHQLLEDEQEDRDVSAVVPEHGSYRVGCVFHGLATTLRDQWQRQRFAGMGIIHTAKKEVAGLLFMKYKEKQKNFNNKELLNYCEAEAKTINLNIVRLRFSAHDIDTDQEICEPVFSEPIHNLKSAATNDLKICRISRLYGQPKGGDDVFILVEKVNKKNIEIRFVERNETGQECWSAKAHFLLSDVHHQYAIVFRTPPYKDPQITSDVKVYVELVRPSDGRCSDPQEFTYEADQLCKKSKKRKTQHSPYSSFGSSLGNVSIKSFSDLPATVLKLQQESGKFGIENEMIMDENVMLAAMPQLMQDSVNLDLGDALMDDACEQSPTMQVHCTVSPMLSQSDLTPIHLNSAEFNQILDMPAQDDYNEYLRQYVSSTNMDFLRVALDADSGQAKDPKVSAARSPLTEKNPQNEDKSSEYPATYTPEHGLEVKKLVKEICAAIRSKSGFQKLVVKEKLDRLFSMRLSNGDTFLHMTLFNNHTSFEYVVKLVHAVKMPHLLNLTNDRDQTILHYAILNDLPQLVPFLISKGCDPTVGDQNGNSAVHYAVLYQTCMEPLLEAIKSNGVHCDLNAENKEKQTALHLAAVPGADPSSIESSRHCIKLLLKHGASYNARDQEGRTPLHLAAYDDSLPVLSTLLEFIPSSDIDAVDGRGNTALQIVCGGEVRPNTVAILKLLLEKKADPMAHEPHSAPAWRLARDKPALRALLAPLAPLALLEPLEPLEPGDIKSEPEDEYESADEGATWLGALPLYEREVSALLDASGAWRALASRVRHDALANWYAHTPSPTGTLLHQLKESQDSSITSKSLMLILEDMGQIEAARIIRNRIGNNLFE